MPLTPIANTVPDRGQVYHPLFGQAVNYSLQQLPDDNYGQVAGMIAAMKEVALHFCGHPLIQRYAAQAIAEGNGDPITGVFYWAKNRLKFALDEDQAGQLPPAFASRDIIEVLINPLDVGLLLEQGKMPKEDCDGFSTFAACLLLALGVPCNFCTVAVDKEDPTRYSHVYLVAYPNPDSRVPMDISHGDYPGWECPNPFGKRTEWPILPQAGGLIQWIVVGVLVVVGWLIGKGR